METVYVVMGLHPSHRVNEINAVFKEKKKAEEYCFRHINCTLKNIVTVMIKLIHLLRE